MVTVAMTGSGRNSVRELVMDAVVQVLVRDGLDGLSVRRVAAEAGVSIGAVQYHFATKDALLVAAANHVTAHFKSRAEELTHRVLAEEGAAAAFLAFCQLLANAIEAPDGEAGDTNATIVWLWFAAKATQCGAVADAFAAGWSLTENYLRGLIADLFPQLDAAEEAGHLLAVLDGLAVARASEPDRMPPHRAATIVRRHFARLGGGDPAS